ncbi:MAG TPA: alpha/beta fold hydrolase, partial [Candidatus Limnocylindria bacterium]|nr:alpha/beta fold hydrolase [Candidatus Limnocylindria bacterium]
LFIPGAGDPDHPQASGHLAASLARELGDGFQVVAPEMPGWDDPHYGEWRDAIEGLLPDLGERYVLVGHSLGASALVKYVAEGKAHEPIIGLFLVSTPFWGSDLPDFALPDDFAAALTDVPIFLYHSRNDPEIPLSHLRRYQEHLPNATSRVIEGAEHSFVHGLPQLVRDVQAVTSTSSKTG